MKKNLISSKIVCINLDFNHFNVVRLTLREHSCIKSMLASIMPTRILLEHVFDNCFDKSEIIN